MKHVEQIMGMAVSQLNSGIVDRLFREHSAWLNRWLGRQNWNVSSAEDIASDVFLSLLPLPDLASTREPRALMTTIARRLIYDARRRDDLRRAYEAELAAMPELLAASAEERLLILEALQSIDTILSTLSEKARTAFLFSQLEGLSYAEIAQRLGVSVSMVRKYVAQGLRAAYQVTADA